MSPADPAPLSKPAPAPGPEPKPETPPLTARQQAALDYAPARWLDLWSTAMQGAVPLVVFALALLLPWGAALPAAALLKPAAALALAAAALWAALGYRASVLKSRGAALRGTFLWAAAFMWLAVGQAGFALPPPGPSLYALWVTAWTAAMLVLTWKF
ncbi:MAG: hypothetical protein AAF763_09525 [Pseudomonadota bacterium]